jgi:hypothetical protein
MLQLHFYPRNTNFYMICICVCLPPVSPTKIFQDFRIVRDITAFFVYLFAIGMDFVVNSRYRSMLTQYESHRNILTQQLFRRKID